MQSNLLQQTEKYLLQSPSLRSGLLAVSFLINLLCMWAFTTANMNAIRVNNPGNTALNSASLVKGATVYSIDNGWYLPQAYHLLNGEGLFIQPDDTTSAVRRTPGYSLFFAAHLAVFDDESVYNAIRWSQLVLFATTATLIYTTVVSLGLGYTIALMGAFLHALNAFSGIYTSFTLTESISPFLVAWAVCCFCIALRNNSSLWYGISGAAVAAAFLTRPLTGVLLPCMGIVLCVHRFGQWKALFIQGAFFCIGVTSLWAPWIVRNALITDDVVLLEKAYYDDPMDYGKGHSAFRSWIACWVNPANQSAEQASNTLRLYATEGRSPSEWILAYVQSLPNTAWLSTQKEELIHGLHLLYDCYLHKHVENITTAKERFELPCEQRVEHAFGLMREKFKEEWPLRYYLGTPLLTIMDIIWHSGTYAMAMLNPPNRADVVHFVLKASLFMLQVSVWVSLVLFMLHRVYPLAYRLLLVLPWITLVLVLAWWARYVEARYIVPLYPLGFISLATALHSVFRYSSAWLMKADQS